MTTSCSLACNGVAGLAQRKPFQPQLARALKGKIEYLEQPQMSQETLNKLGAGALKFDSRMMNDPSMGYFAAEQKRIQDDYHKERARRA